MADNFELAISKLNRTIRALLQKLPQQIKNDCTEIRLRSDKPIVIHSSTSHCFVTNNGQAVLKSQSDLYICSGQDITDCFNSLCEYSVYTFQNQINNCFITVCGGNRVGICGSAVTEKGIVTNVNGISSLNIRIAKQYINCSKKLMDFYKENGFCSTVLVGAPACGKTTVLRDAALNMANETKVTVVDERSEILPLANGKSVFNSGIMCDCLYGFPKALGIVNAIRTLSPQLIVFDEIGTFAELDAIADGCNCGVDFITTVHAKNKAEFLSKKIGKELVECGFFKAFGFMNGAVGEITEIVERDELINENSGIDNALHLSGGGGFSVRLQADRPT